MRTDVVVVGSLNADLVTRVARFPAPGETVGGHDFKVHPGGKGANQAYAAARLGGRVFMIGRVGTDAHGDLLTTSLQQAGVDVANVGRDPEAPTGLALITLDNAGENQIVLVSGANGRLQPEHVLACEGRIASAAVVLLQLEVPMATVEAAARVARAGGATVILDPAPAQALSPALLDCVDYLTPNQSELAVLTGEGPGREERIGARRLLAGGRRRVVVKKGEEGARLFDGDREYFWPALRVPVVDSTGAGDAFNAALAVALAEGRTIEEAGRFAVVTGALCVTRHGAQPSMPTRAEVEAMVQP
jgi:ribokinase